MLEGNIDWLKNTPFFQKERGFLFHVKEVTVGTCTYCGKPAGFLKSKHIECEEQHQKREQIIKGGRALTHSPKISLSINNRQDHHTL